MTNDLQNYVTMLAGAGIKYLEKTSLTNPHDRYVLVAGRAVKFSSRAKFRYGKMIDMDVVAASDVG